MAGRGATWARFLGSSVRTQLAAPAGGGSLGGRERRSGLPRRRGSDARRPFRFANFPPHGVFLVATRPIGPTLIGPAPAGTNFAFSFQSQSGVNSTVEYNDDLTTTNWIFCTNLAGTGSQIQCWMPMTNAPQRFFRVRQP